MAKDVKKAKANKPAQPKKPKVVNVKVGNGKPILQVQYVRGKKDSK